MPAETFSGKSPSDRACRRACVAASTACSYSAVMHKQFAAKDKARPRAFVAEATGEPLGLPEMLERAVHLTERR